MITDFTRYGPWRGGIRRYLFRPGHGVLDRGAQMRDDLINAARILAGQHPAKTKSNQKACREFHEGLRDVPPMNREKICSEQGSRPPVKTVLCRIAGADWV